jgi:hypothetical protein
MRSSTVRTVEYDHENSAPTTSAISRAVIHFADQRSFKTASSGFVGWAFGSGAIEPPQYEHE